MHNGMKPAKEEPWRHFVITYVVPGMCYDNIELVCQYAV